jgi:hypothetical protein
MATREQLESFFRFASTEIDNGGAALSMDELYGLWRSKHPTATELSDSVSAVKEAYAEIEAGETGRPARAALRETCQRLGLLIDE